MVLGAEQAEAWVADWWVTHSTLRDDIIAIEQEAAALSHCLNPDGEDALGVKCYRCADADRLAEALRVAVEYVTDTEYTAACQVADEQAREALRQHDGSDFARKTNRTQAAKEADGE